MDVGLLSSVSALALVGYTGAVIYHGNLMTLLKQVATDWSFIEVPISAGILFLLYQNQYLQQPIGIIVGLAIFAMLIKVFSNTAAKQALNDLAAGKISLIGALSQIGSNIP
jgi:hypothetical protein